jgi:hypothetical protein
VAPDPVPPSEAEPQASDGGAAEETAATPETASTADTADSEKPAATLCERICILAGMTSCPPPADCVPACEQSLTEPCGSELGVLLGCEAEGKADDYTCDARGRRRLKEGLCVPQEQALVDCLTASLD